jgi:hypothetical protein
MITRMAQLSFLMASVLGGPSAFGANVTVQFAGQVTGSQFLLPVGAWVTGCFSYDPNGTQLQSAARPIFSISSPQHRFRHQENSFAFDVFNDWYTGNLLETGPSIDGLRVAFAYPRGYGGLVLWSTDLAMFPDARTPATVPALGRFDHSKGIHITVDTVQPYKSVSMSINHLKIAPATPSLPRMTWANVGGEIQLQFNADPTLNYVVEATDSLTSPIWAPVREIAGIEGSLNVTRGAGFQFLQFFRLRQLPCDCLQP